MSVISFLLSDETELASCFAVVFLKKLLPFLLLWQKFYFSGTYMVKQNLLAWHFLYLLCIVKFFNEVLKYFTLLHVKYIINSEILFWCKWLSVDKKSSKNDQLCISNFLSMFWDSTKENIIIILNHKQNEIQINSIIHFQSTFTCQLLT